MLAMGEIPARIARVKQLMERLDLDAVVVIDWSRDEILSPNQRWLTGYIPLGGPAAALVYRDGPVELISHWIGPVISRFYADNGLPVETARVFSETALAERVGRRNPKRIGYTEGNSFSAAIHAALAAIPSSPALVDVSEEFAQLRMVKSEVEIAAIRQSCAIADKVWGQAKDIFRVGRKNFEVLADVDHLVRLEGAEGGFHILVGAPFRGFSMDILVNREPVEANTRYVLEISPRYEGYWSQLTIPVTTIPDDEVVSRAHRAIVDAKAFAQPRMVPGADLTVIAGEVGEFLSQRGYKLATQSMGHFCGMALEEPRHDPSKPCILSENMTLIFHPTLVEPGLMRADTYLITATGAERLNKFEEKMLHAA